MTIAPNLLPQALLVYGDSAANEEIGCQAALISETFLLTAARCASLGW